MKRPILGLTKNVLMHGEKKNTQIIARVDTGATISSIDKTLANELGLGPVIREKIVKQQTGKTTRPIIKATITIHDIKMTEEFTVADRKNMKYSMLIGQNILKKGAFLVDPLLQE